MIGHPYQKTHSPKSERMKAFLANKRIDPSETLIVGDSPDDIFTAHTTGAIGVCITDGLFSMAKLKAAKPHHLVSNILEVRDVIAHYHEG